MTQTAETLSAQAVQLPPEERMAIVERMLEVLTNPIRLWMPSGPKRRTPGFPPTGVARFTHFPSPRCWPNTR